LSYYLQGKWQLLLSHHDSVYNNYLLATHNSNIFPFSYASLTRFSKYFPGETKNRETHKTSKPKLLSSRWWKREQKTLGSNTGLPS